MPRKAKKKVTKLTKKQLKKVKVLDDQIESLDTLDSMTSTEIERTVSAFSPEGVALRAERKSVRYQLYRLRTESEGKCAAESDVSFRARFESQDLAGVVRIQVFKLADDLLTVIIEGLNANTPQ